eukprot:CAMPEP_0181455848 /NCGR_PEP_ID=MMETSP1110-20121109/30965_1 /TAXON_ID=174948 /ORGANISM="Symbiodinium sp., Strain CCMP421" /LENGTH=295 /DNA_ID=CAMNT_0023580237 /DNA_START=15 /DNA_END=903 /DNA_ORIENTATION=+
MASNDSRRRRPEKGFRPYHSVSVPKSMDLVHSFQADRPKTTVMLRNIPNRYSQASLLQEIDAAGYEGTYDFFYLPMDTQNRTNVGYAFINFLTPQDLERFMTGFAAYAFQQHCSQKLAQVSLAHIQGFIENIRHFSNRAVAHSRNSQYRPVVVHRGVRMDISDACDLLCSVQGKARPTQPTSLPSSSSAPFAVPPTPVPTAPAASEVPASFLAPDAFRAPDCAGKYCEARKGFEEAVSRLLSSYQRPEHEDDDRKKAAPSRLHRGALTSFHSRARDGQITVPGAPHRSFGNAQDQ